MRPRLNASAIGGEYLSAASFLGVAGLLLGTGCRREEITVYRVPREAPTRVSSGVVSSRRVGSTPTSRSPASTT